MAVSLRLRRRGFGGRRCCDARKRAVCRTDCQARTKALWSVGVVGSVSRVGGVVFGDGFYPCGRMRLWRHIVAEKGVIGGGGR